MDGDTSFTSDIFVSGNSIFGCTEGITADSVNGGDLSGNLLETNPSQSSSAGIMLASCIGLGVDDNRVVGFATAIGSTGGIADRYAANIIATGGRKKQLGSSRGQADADRVCRHRNHGHTDRWLPA